MSNDQTTRLEIEIAHLKAQVARQEDRIRLDDIRFKAIIKKCDAYAMELHALKNPKSNDE